MQCPCRARRAASARPRPRQGLIPPNCWHRRRGRPRLGSPDAKVVIIEYASATCPHCARFHKRNLPGPEEGIYRQRQGEVIFREFPFDNLPLRPSCWPVARLMTNIIPLIDIFFEQQEKWTVGNAADELAKSRSLPAFTRESFDACLKNEPVAKGIHEIRDRAGKEFGVESTPTFFINGQVLQRRAAHRGVQKNNRCGACCLRAQA